MFGIGMGEILIVLALVILFFGGKKIPELMKGLARASHEFKKAKETIEQETNELKRTAQSAVDEFEKPAINAPNDTNSASANLAVEPEVVEPFVNNPSSGSSKKD